jgi:predicted amidohydrolase
MKNLLLATAQYPITFHAHADDWAAHTAAWVREAAARDARLLLFPEYASMELASLMPEDARRDLHAQIRQITLLQPHFMAVFGQLAQQYGLMIAAPSIPVQVADKTFNRCYVFGPEGLAGYQDKWFMTRFEKEEWFIDAGKPELSVFQSEWGAFGVQTCYDVEFPVGSALLCRAGAHLILAPSCTETIRGATRVHVGARARALENQCYVAVSQVVGEALWSPAVDINYGYTAVYSTPDTGLPEEGVLALAPPQQPGWLYQLLDWAALETVRETGAVLNAKDHGTIRYDFSELAVKKVRI